MAVTQWCRVNAGTRSQCILCSFSGSSALDCASVPDGDVVEQPSADVVIAEEWSEQCVELVRRHAVVDVAALRGRVPLRAGGLSKGMPQPDAYLCSGRKEADGRRSRRHSAGTRKIG